MCNNIAAEKCPGCGGKKYCFDHVLLHGHIRGSKLVSLVIRIKDDYSTKHGQKDTNYYNRVGSQIMNEIRTFATNLLYLNHTSDTNIISLTANWAREDVRSMVNKILAIKEVDGWLKFPNYIEELEEAKETHDFFKVVALSSTLLESYGKQILTKYFGEKNKEIGNERILGLSFNGTVIMLCYCGIIDKELFRNINNLKKERNGIIHEMSNPDLIKLLSKERIETMEQLADKAIHSISELMEKLKLNANAPL